jgi:hypothetical protein
VVEQLPSKFQVLSSKSSTAGKRKQFQIPEKTLVQWMEGGGFPTASQGRKASASAETVKLAALPPTILGFSSAVPDRASEGESVGSGF